MDNNNMGVMSNSPSLTPQFMNVNANQMGMSSGMAVPLQGKEGMKPAVYGGTSNGQMFDLCKNHMNKFVQLTTNDNSTFAGIITGLDEDYVHLAVPNWGQSWSQGGSQGWGQEMVSYCHHCRAYHGMHGGGFHGGGSHGGGHHGGGFHGGGFPRPFFPFSVPLATLVALSLIPWY